MSGEKIDAASGQAAEPTPQCLPLPRALPAPPPLPPPLLPPPQTAASKWAAALRRLSKEDRERFDFANEIADDPKAVLDSVLAVTKTRKDECLRKRWKLVVKGRTVILRDVLEKLTTWIQKFMTIGDVAVQYDPVAAALPWAAVRLILQVTVSDVEIFGHVLVSVENVANVISRCHITETLYFGRGREHSSELHDQLSESIVTLYTAILQYLVDVMHYYGLNTAARMAKSILVSKGDMEAKYLPVARAQEEFRAVAELAEAEDLGGVLEGIEDIERELQEKDDRDLARLMSLHNALEDLKRPIDRIDSRLQEIEDGLGREVRAQTLRAISTIPYGAHHKTASKGRLEGSGRWLLNKSAYNDWRRSSSSSVLWLHGIPGSGKTKLASLIVDELKGHEHIAYFYCMRNPAEPQRAQCDKILASLVRQLASVAANTPILPPVVAQYEDAIEGFVGFEDQAWTADESAEVLLQLLDEYPAVVIVIDALDEVNAEDRQELLDALTCLLQHPACLVRVFISSRSNYDIALYLHGTPNIYIEADDNAEDISSFIDKQLTSAKLLHGKLTPDLREEIVLALEFGAKGMFRWVDLQIQSLRLLKVAADVRARLGVLPDTLEGSYWEIFRQIRDSGENAFRLATFAFQWLLYARESISINGFAVLASTALAPEPGVAFTAEEVLDVCANLIITRQTSFDFAHLSVREFFERLQNRNINEYLPSPGHAAIAQACLQYLNLALVEGKSSDLKERVLSQVDVPDADDKIYIRVEQSDDLVDNKDDDRANDTRSNPWERDGSDDEDQGENDDKESTDSSVFRRIKEKNTQDNIEPGSSGTQNANEVQMRLITLEWVRRLKEVPEIKRFADELFAVVSSDVEPDVPSLYATLYGVYHVDKAKDLRLDGPLSELIRIFMLETSRTSDELIHKVGRGFRACSSIGAGVKATNPDRFNSSAEFDCVTRLPPSPIWVACEFDWLDIVEFLYKRPYPGIDAGRRVISLRFWDSVDNFRRTISQRASQWIGLENPSTQTAVNPLWYAMLAKKQDLLTCLLKYKAATARVFSVEKSDEPLVLAAKKNDVELISILSKQNYGGQYVADTAFEEATWRGHCESMKLLMDLSLISLEQAGHNALCIACTAGEIDTVNFLLDNNAPTSQGAPMLYRAVLHQHHEIIRLLLSKRVGLDGVSNALVTAISSGDDECASLLLEHGAQKDGAALMRAIRDDTPQTAQRLIAAGFGVNGKYLGERRTVLHYAADKGQLGVVQALLARSAEVDARDRSRRTPLHLAAARGHDDCVRSLLDHGADILAEDIFGDIPVDLANKKSHTNTAELIKHKMADMMQMLLKAKDTREKQVGNEQRSVVSVEKEDVSMG